MDKNEAKELLSFHSTRNSDIDNLKWENDCRHSCVPARKSDLPDSLFSGGVCASSHRCLETDKK